MRFVLKYTAGDDCTWSTDVILPIEAESGEEIVVRFEEECRKHNTAFDMDFEVFGLSFCSSNFIRDGVYYGPDVLTIDEWFERDGAPKYDEQGNRISGR